MTSHPIDGAGRRQPATGATTIPKRPSGRHIDERAGSLASSACPVCRLWVFPLVIGSGKRLFSDGTIPSALTLVDSRVSTTGVVIGTYEPAGEIVTGSFALD